MTERLSKVNRLLQKEISTLFLHDVEFPKNVLATVTRVETTPNFQQARVFVSVFPQEHSDGVISLLSRRVFFIQQTLNKRLKMRPVPRIEWTREAKTAEAQRIEELLERAKHDIE
ncbi:MAG: 30S ribosome-binding factor RbfA [Candidatus Wildermuthbacteria bacterium]|nr:30S ribosome-binding factor RbfA [Candidatus Wildermuthbacteria bacterium]